MPSFSSTMYLPFDDDDVLSFLSMTPLVPDRYTEIMDLQMVASATLFYLILRGRPSDYGLPVRLRALKVTIAALQTTLRLRQEEGLQLAKNCCHTLRNFQSLNELAVYARELATTLLRAAMQFDDRTVRLTAIHLCCHQIASLHPRYKAKIGKTLSSFPRSYL